MIFITYDPALPYPQPAQFGRGVGHADGTHVPESGKASFGVHEADLIHGIDERFYQVDLADSLAPHSQTTVDDLLAADAQAQADEDAINQSRKDDRVNVHATVGNARGLPEVNDTVDRLINIIEGLK